MAQQEATYDPFHYAVWYEYLADINPELSAAINTQLATTRPITDEIVRRLHGRYISGRDVTAIETAQHRLRTAVDRTLLDVREASAQVRESAARLTQATLEFRITHSLDTAALIAEHVANVGTLLQQIASALENRRGKTASLIDTLERSHSEPIRDPLTRTLNRLGLRRALDDLGADNYQLDGVALLMIDIDAFKAINDSYGHLVGDSVLFQVARVISDCAKAPQIVARLGGEEFVLVIPAAQTARCENTANSICSRVAQLKFSRDTDGKPVSSVSVSIGIALAKPGDSQEHLMHRADQAMYQAKRAGGNRFVWAPRDGVT